MSTTLNLNDDLRSNSGSGFIQEPSASLQLIGNTAELAPEQSLILRQISSLLLGGIYQRIGAALGALFGTQLTEEEEAVLEQVLHRWWRDHDERMRMVLEIADGAEASRTTEIEALFSKLAGAAEDPTLLFWAGGVQARASFNAEAISAVEAREDLKKAELLREELSRLESQLTALRQENAETLTRLKSATENTLSKERESAKTKRILEELLIAT